MRTGKDAYYFSHDSNAKDDPKCVLLIEQLGLEGYGIFWILVETFREQPDFKYPLKLIPALSRRYNTTAEKMKTVVGSYGLFGIENDRFFFSESLNRRMAVFLESRRKKSEAGSRGNQIRWGKNKITKLSQCDNNTITSKVKESKLKEILLFEEVKEEEYLLNSNSPDDGIERNWEGLQRILSNLKGSTKSEINTIIRLSNFGQIGHPVWRLISEITNSESKLHSPAAFIISRLKQQ
jgi:hypothetical protein